MALSMGSDIQMLSPQEDALAIPASKRPMIDDKKEKIEYFFRIAIYWQDDSTLGGLRLQDHQSQSALATLLLRGRRDRINLVSMMVFEYNRLGYEVV